MNALVDDIVIIFPELTEVFKDFDVDKQKSLVMQSFFKNYLGEFNVDVENVKRVQLGQHVSSDDVQMISMLNLLCACNTLIPNINMKLMDFIQPSKETVITKINHALKFYEFVDSLTSEIYDKINPYTTARNEISSISAQTDEVQEAITNIVTLKIPHVEQLIETVEGECEDICKKNEDINAEYRALQQQLQQTKSEILFSLRKKHQSEQALKILKEKLQVEKLTLNQSTNCDEQISSLSDKLSSLKSEVKTALEGTEQEIAAQAELITLRDCLSERFETVKKINETLSRLNELKNEKKRYDEDADVIKSALNDATKDVAEEEKKKDLLGKNHSIELQSSKNRIELRRRSAEENRSKLKDLKKKRDRLQEIKNNLATIHKEYLIEENILKEMERKTVKARWETLDRYKRSALRIQALKSEKQPNNDEEKL